MINAVCDGVPLLETHLKFTLVPGLRLESVLTVSYRFNGTNLLGKERGHLFKHLKQILYVNPEFKFSGLSQRPIWFQALVISLRFWPCSELVTTAKLFRWGWSAFVRCERALVLLWFPHHVSLCLLGNRETIKRGSFSLIILLFPGSVLYFMR